MIEFRNVSLAYGERNILQDASFRVNRGERVGIVGPNGAGKTTLFQLILGECTPLGGSVLVEGYPRIGHVRQHAAEKSDGISLLDYAMEVSPVFKVLEDQLKTATKALQAAGEARERARCLRLLGDAQTAFEHAGGYGLEARIKAALCGLGFAKDSLAAPFDTFSGGWRMRAELVRNLAGDPDILLLDEPSNYLDLPAVEWLQRFTREFDGTLLLISHDRFLLQSLTQVTLEVDAATVTRYEGDWRYYRREREQRHAVRVATRSNIERERVRMQRFVARFRSQASKASLVQSRIKAINRLPDIPLPARSGAAGHLRIAPPPHSGAETIRLESAGFAYEAGRWIFRNASFSLNRGDRAALVGYNGMGKTTLMRLMAGIREPTEGRVVQGFHVTPGYLSQALTETLPVERSIISILRDAAPGQSENNLRSLLGSFGFSGDAIVKTCGVLSGGERIRLAFARLYALKANFLLLDEPTTHLDMEGREALEAALKNYAGTLCVVSHDVAFVEAIANRIIAVNPDGINLYPGGYAAFSERPTAASSTNPQTPATGGNHAAPGNGKVGNARHRRRARAEARAQRLPLIQTLKKRILRLEKRIIETENEQARCVATLQAGGIADHEEINRRLKMLQRILDEANREWEKTGQELAAVEST